MNAQDQIRVIIDRLADAWNENDIRAFASLFSEDGDYISGTGLWLRGQRAIQEGLSIEAASSGEHSTVVITGSWIKFIKADVAIVHTTWEMRTGSDVGEKRQQSRNGIMTQVIVSEGERWRVAALQNTDIKGWV